MKRMVLGLAAIILVAMTAGCTSDAVVSEGGVLAAAAAPSEGSSQATIDPRLAQAINAFGFDLLSAVQGTEESDGATVISPLSVHAALSMAANGASGETLGEMRRALRLDAIDEDDANAAYANLLGRLNASIGTTTSVANSMWIDEGLPVKQAFVSANQKYFGAEMRSLELQDPAAPKAINSWVDEQTHGKIDRVVPHELDPQAVLEIVNATYFDAKWALPFDPQPGHVRPFLLPDGSNADVPMMGQLAAWRHVMNAKYEAIELPYAGGSASMVVVQTSPLSSASAAVPQFTGESFEQLWTELKSTPATEGSIVLPKVETRWETSLIDALKSLSMVRAFDATKSDLSRISDVGPLLINRVQHKTYLRVDEEGTEAAAVTEVGVAAAGSSSGPMPFQMIVDEPYLMAIVDNDSGAVLFLAAVSDPRAK